MSGTTRLARKREKTRQALLGAARMLVSERGREPVAIQDITGRAGVGLGTFYNYFDSKESIFEAVLADMRVAFNASLDEVRRPVKDPAMLVAITLKYCLQQALDDEEWNGFVKNAGLTGEHTTLTQDREQCLADVRRGIAAGRFRVEDPTFAASLIMGMVRHAYDEIKATRMERRAIDDTIRYVLRMLGLPDAVARALIQVPMPPVAAARRTVPAAPAEPQLLRA